MKWLMLPLSAFILSSCDRVSQRIWNCSSKPLPVTKVLDTGERANDTIPARNFVTTMKQGVQIEALEQGGRVIWTSKRNLWVRAELARGLAASADEACGGRDKVLVAEEF